MPDIFVADKRAKKRSNLNLPKKLNKKKSKAKKKKDPDIGAGLGLRPTKNPISSFCYYPDGIQFINKDPEEKTILLLRKHPLTNLGWIIVFIFMLFAPTILTVFPFFELLPPGFQVMAVVIWYMITTAFVMESFLSWYFNVNIITDERIIEVDFYSLLYREITDANIDQIQDVTVEMGGAIRTFFNFGRVEIQTAAENPRVDFEAVPKPDAVARILRELRVQEEQEKIEGRVR